MYSSTYYDLTLGILTVLQKKNLWSELYTVALGQVSTSLLKDWETKTIHKNLWAKTGSRNLSASHS